MTPKFLAALAGLALSACAATPLPAPEVANPAPDASTVQVMILGTYHFDNPGLDLVNAKVDDVLAPQRQAEIEALVNRLAEFQPTAVEVESTWRDENLLSEGYKAFTPEKLTTERNEIIQIGYRLANQLGLDRVYAIDENEGEISFFPFDRLQEVAARTGQEERVNEKIASIQADAAAQEAAQATHTISESLIWHNDPDVIRDQHRDFYYGLIDMTDKDEHAGAALNYGWYARNALIFANIAATAKPGDRIVVLYGSGHAYWLRHFVEETPGYTLVESVDYLR